jgi:hypothetical protein
VPQRLGGATAFWSWEGIQEGERDKVTEPAKWAPMRCAERIKQVESHLEDEKRGDAEGDDTLNLQSTSIAFVNEIHR